MRFLSAVFLLIQASLMTCSLFILSLFENHEPFKKKKQPPYLAKADQPVKTVKIWDQSKTPLPLQPFSR